MNKKFIFIIVFAVALVLILGAVFWLKPKEVVHSEGSPINQGSLELVCMADTKEEAEKIAADYGIELLSYDEKVAVFQTDKSYTEILEIGQNKGLPELSLNSINKAY